MSKTKKDRRLHERIAIDIAGFGLMIIAPFLGWLPGPGGIPLFLAGLGLVSLNHEWAENLLKDFEKKRQEFTERFLLANPIISRSIDLLCLLIIAAGVYIAATQSNLLWRGLGFGSVSISLIVILSNQKRLERISSWLKNRFKHSKK